MTLTVDGAAKATPEKRRSSAPVNPVTLVIDLLLANGWKPDTRASRSTIKLPTRCSPIYGYNDGSTAYGGRKRFRGGGHSCTVGKFSTFFYHKDADGTQVDGQKFRTRDLEKIKDFIATLNAK